jgi:type I restriction-modification system DNA methylase subunit
MPTTDAPKAIVELVARFSTHREAYVSGKYNEAQLRVEFIDPMWLTLGWDVHNVNGYAEAYKDVIHEDAIKISADTFTKAPDYCFRIGGQRKFFLEAKKPSVDIKDDPAPAFQLRRYAWSAKLPLSVLTDFEELAVYDTRVKPDKTDKASKARTLLIPYTEYVARWDEIASVFSRDAVLFGSFDKYADTSKGRRGTAAVDAAFLVEIEKWREELARNIALRNPSLATRELNFAVQATIDRIVFLRISEDRGIEPYAELLALTNGGRTYRRLFEVFERADGRYNSGLFHFQKERDRHGSPDVVSASLEIDDAPLKSIIRSLYYPDSPYEFSVLGADILGQVYEQFLGKVIRLTTGHRAVVEEKPEVKKAGGVYYTPTFIVDYIVRETVGPLLTGRTPATLARSPVRVVDVACGSGSFLLRAYEYLLDWYRDWYVNNGPKKRAAGKSPVLYQAAGGDWRLSTRERKRILLAHIFGVDIDEQAVEVTKLSLLLKVLEGESNQTLQAHLRLFNDRVLPDLDGNIKAGNSLIDSDFYQQQEMPLLDAVRERRINVFDWKSEFPQVFRSGGFDAVVGNPPYIRIQALNEFYPEEAAFYKTRYVTGGQGSFDIYVLFVERGLSLLNAKGRLGFILPNKFFNAKYGAPLRAMLAAGKHVSQIVNFGDQQVFVGPSTYTAIMVLTKQPNAQAVVSRVPDLAAWRADGQAEHGKLSASKISASEWNLVVGGGGALFERLRAMPVHLEHVADRIFQGIKTAADKVYIVEERARQRSRVQVFSPERQAEFWLEPDLLHPLVKGGDSSRYHLAATDRLILFPYQVRDGGTAALIPERTLRQEFPLTWAYLSQNRAVLENRERGVMRGPRWYAYGRTQALDVMPLPKIFTPDIATHPSYSLDRTGEFFFTGGVAGGYGILVSSKVNREYVLGLLNSKLLDWYIRQTATQMRGGYFSYESRYIRHLPIQIPAANERARVAKQERLSSLVNQMQQVQQELANARSPQDRTMKQRQSDSTSDQIDALVYELYDVSDDEIKRIEETVARSDGAARKIARLPEK